MSDCQECDRLQRAWDKSEAEVAALRLERDRLLAICGQWSETEKVRRRERDEARLERDALRETNSRLNRRCQEAEGIANGKMEEAGAGTRTVGRALANAAARIARKRINPTVYFGIEHLGGRMVRYTCKTCGRKNDEVYAGEKGPTDERFIKKMVVYQNQSPGVSGHCPRCTKRARDEAWPLEGPADKVLV